MPRVTAAVMETPPPLCKQQAEAKLCRPLLLITGETVNNNKQALTERLSL